MRLETYSAPSSSMHVIALLHGEEQRATSLSGGVECAERGNMCMWGGGGICTCRAC